MSPAHDYAEYDPPNRVRELPSWLVAQVARRAQLLIEDALAPEGARRHHYVILASLAEQGHASQADLGRRLWIDRSDLHAMLNDLEERGWVARVRDEDDRRRNVVTLTRPGRAALARLDKRVHASQDALLASLSATERRELLRLLERVIADD
jgi:MarR family transcriptional regulator, lower aerobic nicotinate degradation pathway regulator